MIKIVCFFVWLGLGICQSAVFDPTTLSGLVAGYIGDSGTSVVFGNRVSAWNDQSGNGNNLAAGSTSVDIRMPNLVSGLNGSHSYVSFTREYSSQVLNRTTTVTMPVTLVMLMRNPQWNNDTYYFSAASGPLFYAKSVNGTDQNNRGLMTNPFGENSDIITNTWCVVFVEFISGSSSSYIKVNFGSKHTGAPGAGANGTSIALGNNFAGGNAAMVDIAECWIYSSLSLGATDYTNFVDRANTLYNFGIAGGTTTPATITNVITGSATFSGSVTIR